MYGHFHFPTEVDHINESFSISFGKGEAVNIRKLLIVILMVLAMGTAHAGEIVKWDFTTGAHGWKGNGYLQKTGVSSNGLRFKGIGVDPQFTGPAYDFPAGTELLVKIRMRTDNGATADLFYGEGFSDEQKVRFDTVPDMQWQEYEIFLPELGPGMNLRLDPFNDTGSFEISDITVYSATPITPPEMDKPLPLDEKIDSHMESFSSGLLTIHQYDFRWGRYFITIDGMRFAEVNDDAIGLTNHGFPEWIHLNKSVMTDSVQRDNEILQTFTVKDNRGATWTLTRKFSNDSGTPGSIMVTEGVEVDRDSDVIHIPWLTMFPGLGTFGEHKKQALFAGLEYLADEPSSSEADLHGAQHIRTVPDPVKITFPLMVIQNNGRYIGVIWEPSKYVAAVFDSPDRIFESGASLMALWGPGVGSQRRENSSFAYDTFHLNANEKIEVNYTIIGGAGDSVVPAIQQYVSLKGFPPIPDYEGGLQGAVDMLAGGWLDSELRLDGLWRHAVSGGNNFLPQRAADAPMFMLQLANLTNDPDLAQRLRKVAGRGLDSLEEINPDTGKPYDPNIRSGVGHIRFPSQAMLFGKASEFTAQYVAEAWQFVANEFDAQGIRHYIPTPGRPDYGSTHFEDHANGYSATVLFYILEAARLSGNDDLIKKGIFILDRMTEIYANSEPRGAQTWEIPLHTPDIMASAYLVKCYVLAYSMTLDKKYLEQAEYWAWTGIPFVYLATPTPGPVGTYSTIAVYGATSWESPNWIGLPVQWCGLVYASALRMLAKYEPNGPWAEVASGITATGLQMSYPAETKSRVGLLPDSYNLKFQRRNGPDINPGTEQAHIAELFDKGRLYDFVLDPQNGWFIHAPCGLSEVKDGLFTTDGFGAEPYSVLISNIAGKEFEVYVSAPDIGAEKQQTGNFKYFPDSKILVINGLVGAKRISINTQ